MTYPSTIEADIQNLHERVKSGLIQAKDVIKFDRNLGVGLQAISATIENPVDWLYEYIQLDDTYQEVKFDPQYYPPGECPKAEMILISTGLRLRVACYLTERKISVDLVSSGVDLFKIVSVQETILNRSIG